MQNFYEGIRLSLIEYGAIRRSQTLLGSTAIDIEAPYQWIKKQSENYKILNNTLKNKHKTIQNKIKKSINDACESLKYEIESVFQDALNTIPSFAEDYWNHSETSLQQGWEQKLKNIRFEERLSIAYQEVITTFGQQVEEYLKEIGNELQIIAQLGGMTFSFKKQDSDDERNFFRIGGGIIAVAGAVMAFIPPVAGAAFIVSILGGVISFIGGFFKSKDQKRREAVANISSSLENQVNNQKQITLSKAVEQMYIVCGDVANNIDKYFNDLIEGLEAIAQQLDSVKSKLTSQVNNFNNAYAKRIIDWSLKCYEPLISESVDSTIARVNRNFGRKINIEVKVFIQLQRTQDEINRVIQEDICIQISQPTIPAGTPNFNIPTPTLPQPEAATKPKEKFQGVIGIDLGTTNSVMAVIKNGLSMVIPNKEGFSTTPSVVAYTYGSTCLVGQAAKRQAIKNPLNTFDSVMRFVGKKYDEVTEQAKEVLYQVLQDTQGKIKIDCPVLGKQFTPEEILAEILRKLADDATQYLDAQVIKVVLTVPAYFDDIQRHAVKEAGCLAGLDVLRIIPNPTAAAMAYGRDKENHETTLFFDLGGGHLSISILEIGDGVFEVLSYSGDTQLGGNDFDQKIIDWVAQEFKHLDGNPLYYYKQAWQRLREAAEQAKIELSNTTQTTIDLPWMTNTTSVHRNTHLKLTLARQKFEQLCADLINRCRVSVENALKDAHLDKSDIDKVILVGGSTRIPAVQKFLQHFFGKEPKQGLNIDELVALGASVQAGVLDGNVTGILLLDVNPLSLGVETLGGVMTKIIPRNTSTPTKKSEVFTTAADGQTYVDIHVLQGEAELASNNKSLGILRLDGISLSPRGVPQIEVIFEIDANGVLIVIAKEKGTGKVQSMTITGAFTLSQEYQKHKVNLASSVPNLISAFLL
ncbi:hypothetical protein CAL7716_026840 [Calothrix sp. PCC 7716]|nr:hypothetical protein CAL7716_026840 [Calothrix sp. PCC 7716]